MIPTNSSIPPLPMRPYLPLSINTPVIVTMIKPTAKISANIVQPLRVVVQAGEVAQYRSSADAFVLPMTALQVHNERGPSLEHLHHPRLGSNASCKFSFSAYCTSIPSTTDCVTVSSVIKNVPSNCTLRRRRWWDSGRPYDSSVCLIGRTQR